MPAKKTNIHPASILILIGLGLSITFLQMQKRQLAYQVAQQVQQFREQRELKVNLEIKKAKLMRPTQMQKAAERLTMRQASFDQIIIMSPIKAKKGMP